MENVPGLLVREAREKLDEALAEKAGFEIVGPIVIDAWDFGAATRRARVVVVGYDKKYVTGFCEKDIEKAKRRSKATARDAISDLPEPADRDWLPYKEKEQSELSQYARSARMKPASDLGSVTSRQRLAKKEVSGVRSTRHTKEVIERFGGNCPAFS